MAIRGENLLCKGNRYRKKDYHKRWENTFKKKSVKDSEESKEKETK
tara:strand:+ start:1021 stop:1158 length:138 start_codon:yes stop_codon:yes gene_type:complete